MNVKGLLSVSQAGKQTRKGKGRVGVETEQCDGPSGVVGVEFAEQASFCLTGTRGRQEKTKWEKKKACPSCEHRCNQLTMHTPFTNHRSPDHPIAEGRRAQKTYNTRDSLVVTDPTTSLALIRLTRGERTGSRTFVWIWSYVKVSFKKSIDIHKPRSKEKIIFSEPI